MCAKYNNIIILNQSKSTILGNSPDHYTNLLCIQIAFYTNYRLFDLFLNI